MKRIISVLLACLVVLTLCVGCGNTKKGSVNRKKDTLTISVFDGGYGTEFLNDIAVAYEAEYPNIDVVIEKTDLFSEIRQQVQADRYVADIIITITDFTRSGVEGKVLDITDVYDSYPYGEDNIKTVREKLGAATDANEFDGKYYQIPIHSGSTGIVYNKVYLDAIYGEGEYTLPLTSQQLINMCKDIKSKNAWATVYTNSTEAEYATFLRGIWTAQYLGYDAYKEYYNLSYIDEQGNVKKAETAEEFHSAYRKARTSVYSSLASFLSSDLGYVPPSASSMSYSQAQAYFVGFTSQTDVKIVNGHKGATFMINGDWLYDEVKKYGEEVELDIRFMRTPINSAIIDNLSTVNTEEQLVECIEYIDSVIDETEGTKPAYLSDEDYNRLYEARRMVGTTHSQQIACIPTTCTNEALAKDFLKFVASDGSALMYSNALNGMKSIYSDEVYAETSQNNFTESLNHAFRKPIRVTGLNTPYVVYGGLQLYYNNYFHQNLYKCKDVGDTAKALLQETENKYTNQWSSIVESYQE